MDLKDVNRFSGRLLLEYHVCSVRQKIEKRTERKGKKEKLQPGNKYRWENEGQKLLQGSKEWRVDEERRMQNQGQEQKGRGEGTLMEGKEERQEVGGMKVRR